MWNPSSNPGPSVQAQNQGGGAGLVYELDNAVPQALMAPAGTIDISVVGNPMPEYQAQGEEEVPEGLALDVDNGVAQEGPLTANPLDNVSEEVAIDALGETQVELKLIGDQRHKRVTNQFKVMSYTHES